MRTRSSTAKPAQALQFQTNTGRTPGRSARTVLPAPVHRAFLKHTARYFFSCLGRRKNRVADRPTLHFQVTSRVLLSQCAATGLTEYDVRVNTIGVRTRRAELNKVARRACTQRQRLEARQPLTAWAAAWIAEPVPLSRWRSPQSIKVKEVSFASPLHSNTTDQTISSIGGFVMPA